MSDEETQSLPEMQPPVDRQDQSIADLQRQLQQLQSRVTYLEQYIHSVNQASVEGQTPRRVRWKALFPFVALTLVAVILVAALAITFAPQSGSTASVNSEDAFPTPVSSVQSAQATVRALEKRTNLLFGPASGDLTHMNINSISSRRALVDEQNFIVETRFSNPYQANGDFLGWDYGFIFRRTDPDSEYRLTVDSDKQWSLRLLKFATPTVVPESQLDNPPTPGILSISQDRTVAGGAIGDLNITNNGSNFLRLIANEDTGYFFVNNKLIATLDISGKMESGDIAVGTAFMPDDRKAGAITHYSDFSVWELR